MEVLSLISLPSAIPMGAFSGQVGTQAVLNDLNATWNSCGSGVIFGNDMFGEKFKAFSSMIGQQITEIRDTVLRSVEAVCCPNKFQEITCKDDLYHVPACMFVPILTAPDVRPLFEAGRLDGWGITSEQMPEEDVYGRLINNGRFESDDPRTKDPDFCVSWTYASDDPDLTREELDKIETSRAFISTFLEEQMGEGGDEMDITDMPNRMSKLTGLREVQKKN